MCLIVYKENSNGIFTNRQFRNMIHRNADGLGVMWRESGRVMFEKVLGTPKDKFALFRKHRHKDSWAMHSRMKTHGKIDLDNCHPYELLSINKGDAIDLYVMHNGVLSAAPSVNKDMSDTWHFMEYIIKPIVTANLDLLWTDEHFQQWLASTIKGSKLLFMRSDDVAKPVLILNSDAGKEETGCWLSNTYSTCEVPSYSRAGTGGNAGTNSPFTQLTPKVAQSTPTTTQSTVTGIHGTTTETTNTKLLNPSDKVTVLSNVLKETQVLRKDDSIEEYLVLLHGLSTHSVKEFIEEDPDITADIIHYWYDEKQFPYESILEQIKDKNTVDAIVDIVRHIVSSYNRMIINQPYA